MKICFRLTLALVLLVPALAAQSNGPIAAYAFSDGAAVGRFGAGLAFSGGGPGLRVPVTGLSNAFTFESWINPSSLIWSDFWKQWPDAAGANPIYDLMLTPAGAIYFSAYQGSPGTVNYPIFTVPTVAVNTWTHVAVTFDGSQIRIYFNAVEVGRRTAAGNLQPSSQPMEIGEEFRGRIDELRIYTRALGPAEIALDMATPVDPLEPFQVSLFTPADQSLGVLTTPVTSTFSAAVNAATVTSNTFELRDAADALVPAGVSYDAPTRTARLTPLAPLAALTDYTARVAGGTGGVVSNDGSALPGDVVWTFRTAAPAAVPRVTYAFSEGTGSPAIDASGNGNTGALLHGAAWTTGVYGSGVQFNGTRSDVQIPARDSTTITDAFTFEAWVKPAVYAWGDLWSQYPDNSDVFLYNLAITNTGALYTGPHLGQYDYPMFTTVTLPLDTWTHVALTYDGARVRIYIEGLEVASRLAHGSLATTAMPMEIGQWFNGSLDEVRIYSRALTAAEIAVDRQTPVDRSAAFAVTGITPPNGAPGVVSTPVTAAFSAAADPATLTTSTFELRDSANVPVAASVSYDAATRTATLTPVNPLAPQANYTARVASAVTSTAGSPLASDVTWSFRTAAPAWMPAAAYAFSEGSGVTSEDWSGNGNSASLVHGVSWGSGRFGTSVLLSGNNSVSVPSSDSIALTDAFTFETWANPSAADAWRMIWTRNPDDLGASPLYALETVPGGALDFNVRLGAFDFPLRATATLPPDAWAHVAVTYDGSWVRIYLNGLEVARRTASGSIPFTNEPMQIGPEFRGRLDEVRVYRRALTAAEITADMTLPVDTRQSVISSLTPASAPAGQAVTLAGLNFGATQDSSAVTFNGTAAATTAWSDTSITALVPSGASSGPIVVTKQGVPSNSMPFTVIPVPAISSLSPATGPAGTAVTIAGINFGPAQGSSIVTFNGVAASVTAWSSTSIAVAVPAAATSGPVTVTVGGHVSNSPLFIVNGPRISASLSPAPNAFGWNSSNVTVTFTCTATDAPISFCTSPQLVSWNGAGIRITGQARDQNGVSATMAVTLNVDLAGPAVNVYSPKSNAVFPPGTASVTLKGSAIDVLSGVSSITCAGAAATLVGQNFSCSVAVVDGTNTVPVVVRDVAGRTTTKNVPIVVADVAPVSLSISPATMSLIAGSGQPLSVADERGRTVTGGAWSSSAPGVAVVLVDAGVPTVHALAAGTATITLTRDSLSAQTAVTVLAADATPADGTTLWSLKPTPNPQPSVLPGIREVVRAMPIQWPETSLSQPPALFFVERGPYFQGRDTTAVPAVIRAVTADGRELWKHTLPADPVFGGYSPVRQVVADDRGGLIVVISSSRPACCFQMNEAIRRLDGITGEVTWEFLHRETFARFSEVAVHPNGNVFFVEKLSDANSTDLVSLDGRTGAERGRWDLTFGHVTYPNASTATGPIVQDDGSVVVVASRWDNQNSPQLPKTAWLATLLDSEHPLFNLQPLAHADGTPVNFGIGDIISGPWPDGHGGFLIGNTGNGSSNLIHIGADLFASSSVDLPFGTLAPRDMQYVLGDDMAHILVQYWEGSGQTGAQLYSVNPTTLGIVSSVSLSGGPKNQLTFAIAGGGVLYAGAAQNYATPVSQLAIAGVPDSGPILQQQAAVPVSLNLWQTPRGNLGRREARDLRRGIFLQGYPILFGFSHSSLRLIPRNTFRWRTSQSWGWSFIEDSDENWFVTIGAESSTGGCSGNLISDLNRPNDAQKPLLFFDRALYPNDREDTIIDALFYAYANYHDHNDLPYKCGPTLEDPAYNSNSYTHGLMSFSGLLPSVAFSYWSGWYPGWIKPVPPVNFQPH